MEITKEHADMAIEEMNARKVVSHLLIVIVLSLIAGNLFGEPIRGFWCWVSPVLYIAYLGFKMSMVSAQYKRDEATEAENSMSVLNERLRLAEEKELQLRKLAIAIKADSERYKLQQEAQADALKKEAERLQSLEKDNQTLGLERQQLQKQLADAGNSITELKQQLKKNNQSYSTALEIAKKEADSLRKSLNDIEEGRAKKAFEKSVKATWNAKGKNTPIDEKIAHMDSSFPEQNWRQFFDL